MHQVLTSRSCYSPGNTMNGRVTLREPQVLHALDQKRRETEAHIGSLQRDLSAILASIKVFSADGPRVTAYMNLTRLFPQHELPKLATAALATSPHGISITAIAMHVIAAKGLDQDDRHIRKAICYKVVQIMRRWEMERRVARVGKERTAVAWRLA